MLMETLFALAWLMGFPAMWVALSLIFSHAGGWARLAQMYPAIGEDYETEGEHYRLRSGAIGPVQYGSCLNFHVCKKGLRLSVLFPFRIGHPPLFIPWDEFHTITVRRGFFTCFVDTCVGWPVVAEVVFPIWMIDHLPAVKNSQQNM